MSWKEVAETFRTTWENVYRSVQWVVQYGLAHRSLEGIKAIGIDEVLWHRGHKYLTVVYQLDAGANLATAAMDLLFQWYTDGYIVPISDTKQASN